MKKNEKLSPYNFAPWVLKKDDIESYQPVNDENRKEIITIGRILYVISKMGSNYTFRGTMTIDPCFSDGMYQYPFKPWQNQNKTHFKALLKQTDENEWAETNKALINSYLAEKSLYYKESDPILKYYKN